MAGSGDAERLEGSKLLGTVGETVLVVLKLLSKLPPVIQIVIFLGAVFLSVAGLYRWNAVRQHALSASFAALSGKVEATGQPYKGVEALVLARDAGEASKKPSKLTDDSAALFTAIVTNLKARKSKIPLAKLVVAGKENSTPSDQFLTVAKNETLEDSAPNKTGTNDVSHAFILVPGISIHGGNLERFLQQSHKESNNQEVLDSLDSAMAVWKPIVEFAGKQLFEESRASVVQSFFLLRTGVLVIHQAGIPENTQQEHYADQFTGHTFLPERPYFWRAVNTRRTRIQEGIDRSDAKPDYETSPYVDLGTNGPIETYCWGFVGNDNPGSPEGVLCLDVTLPDAEKRVTSNLERIGATVAKVNCDLETSSCLYAGTNEPDVELSNAAQTSKASGRGQLEVFGGIHVFSTDPVQFHVPLQTYMLNGRRTLSLIECSLDLSNLQFTNNFLLILSLCPLVLAVGALINLASVYAARTRQLRRAVDNVHFVMANATDPYVLVNPEDVIENANFAFAKLLDRPTVADVRGRDVKDFMQADSVDTYNNQKPKREKEKPSEYDITFLPSKKCRLYGAPLPVPGNLRRSIPYTVALVKEVSIQSAVADISRTEEATHSQHPT